MFKRFTKARVARDRHIVRDRYTDKVIYQGTREECAAYVQAFGLCYLEAA